MKRQTEFEEEHSSSKIGFLKNQKPQVPQITFFKNIFLQFPKGLLIKVEPFGRKFRPFGSIFNRIGATGSF